MSSPIRSRLAAGLMAALVLAAGCGTDAPVAEHTAVRSDAIVKGKPDTTHQAVMLQSCTTNCICSGTLVKKDDNTGLGWIVTAAHCLPDTGKNPVPRFFVQGDKAATFKPNLVSTIEPGAVRYAVLDWVRHPSYKVASNPFDGPDNDIGIVRVLGVGSDTPVLPLAEATDGLANKAAVVGVGYGSSGLFNNPLDLGNAGTRQRADVAIKSLSGGIIVIDGDDSGGSINIGDDGGPVIASTAGVETVVGIQSARYGIDPQQDNTRISAMRQWLDGELGQMPKLDNCNSCLRIVNGGNRECAPLNRACLDDADCNAFAMCVDACASTGNVGPTPQCRSSCTAAHPKAPALYDPTIACGCQACAVLCGDTCDDVGPAPAVDGGAPATADAGSPAQPPPLGKTPGNVTGAAPETGCNVGRSSSSRGGATLASLVALALLMRRSARREVRA